MSRSVQAAAASSRCACHRAHRRPVCACGRERCRRSTRSSSAARSSSASTRPRRSSGSSAPTASPRATIPTSRGWSASISASRSSSCRSPGPTGMPYLLTNRVDMVIALFGITPERAQQIWFSIPYATEAAMLVAPASRAVKTVDDLGGLRVGVPRGAMQDLILTPQARRPRRSTSALRRRGHRAAGADRRPDRRRAAPDCWSIAR